MIFFIHHNHFNNYQIKQKLTHRRHEPSQNKLLLDHNHYNHYQNIKARHKDQHFSLPNNRHHYDPHKQHIPHFRGKKLKEKNKELHPHNKYPLKE